MIERLSLASAIQTALRRSRIVALVGPRQVGKTTLARVSVAPASANYFDLEDPVGFASLSEPMTALSPLAGMNMHCMSGLLPCRLTACSPRRPI
ncbi:MAG: hypothetical protein Q8L93_11565 [Rhodocyclaceae bacterium]|nr:hypothetical protein [Rhodocyclaceae bacterium]